MIAPVAEFRPAAIAAGPLPSSEASMSKRFCKTIAAVALYGSLAHAAVAAAVFTGSGTWDSTTPTTGISAPGASWSFGFQLPNVVPDNPTTSIASFTYVLNGMPVVLAPASIEFFAAVDSGMFDIHFADLETASFYGPIVWSPTAFAFGSYATDVGIADGLPSGSGSITLQAVPEPETWAILGAGAMLLGVRSRRGRGTTRAA